MFDVPNTRFVMMGDWEEGDPGGVVLRLVPDNGACYPPTSPATIAMLQEMDTADLIDDFYGKTVLDFGTGSGILAIAAAAMGGIVTVTDHNPIAFAAALASFGVNEPAPPVKLLDEVGNFDVILANVGDGDLLMTLIDRCDLLIGTCETGRKLVSGGRGTKPVYKTDVIDLSEALDQRGRPPYAETFADGWAVIRG